MANASYLPINPALEAVPRLPDPATARARRYSAVAQDQLNPAAARTQLNPTVVRVRNVTRKRASTPNIHRDPNSEAVPDSMSDSLQSDDVVVVPRGWAEDDRLLLLGFLSENLRNHEGFKVNPVRVADRIATEVLSGRKTGDAVRAQWDYLKKKHNTATVRLRSTGEGQRDDMEKWSSIKLSWLDKMCPWYEEIDDILQRFVDIDFVRTGLTHP
jgi:hypothetical protein